MNIAIIAPHCSTGGMPAYVLAYMRDMQERFGHNFHFIEVSNYSDTYTVQRDKIRDEFPWTCHVGDRDKLMDQLEHGAFDVLHFQENLHQFLSESFIDKLNKLGRCLALTSHTRETYYHEFSYVVDKYVAVSEWQRAQIVKALPNADVCVWEYPIIPKTRNKSAAQKRLGLDSSKKHMVQVGLWAPHKCQDWTTKAASYLDDGWQVHLVGNQADNNRSYWEPIAIPENVKVWGERDDVDCFLAAADAFLLPSSLELAPIAIKEALGYKLPCILTELSVYSGMHIPGDVRFIDLDRPETLATAIHGL